MTSITARRLKALGASTVLLALIVGVPVLLVALQLLPHGVPPVGQVLSALRSRDDGQLLEVVLAAAVWVCWALFTASTAAEVVALLRARPVPPVPGLAVFQRPAAALVAVVALGFTLAPMAVGTSTSAAGPASLPPLPVAITATGLSSGLPAGAPLVFQESPLGGPASDVPPRPGETAKSYQVQRRDTLWALAERHLGDPLRYPEIIRLNPNAVGPDNEIVPGTVLAMPRDAVGLMTTGTSPTTSTTVEDVTVHPGDTLWALSEDVTGNGANWTRAWDANRGRPEPGGARFTDPSLIRPGWTISIPAAETKQSPASAPAPAAGSPGTPWPVPPSSAPAKPTAVPASPDESQPRSAAPTTAAPARADAPDLSIIAFRGGGLLLAGLSLSALLRYRRRQFRLRRPGRTITGTTPELVQVERAVQSAGSAALPDVTWLDHALRSLAQSLSPVDDAGLPDVIAACLTDDALTLVLTEPARAAPTPWIADEAGTRWSIQRSDPLPYDDGLRAYTFAPYPTLTSLGSTADGEHWLVDLEAAGIVSLTGDSERCLNLARFLAAELAHNTWSEMLQVTLVGFGSELIRASPERLHYTDDLGQLVTRLETRLQSVSSAMHTAGVGVLSGRLHDIAGDAWAPHVVLVAQQAAAKDVAGLSRLLAAMGQQPRRSAVALVLVNAPNHADAAHWQLTVEGDGTLRVPALGRELTAHQLPADEAAQLAQMLSLAAVTDDRPIPPSHGDQPWEVFADACGNLLVHPQEASVPAGPGAATATGEIAVPPALDESPDVADSAPPLPPGPYLDHAATTEHDLRILTPATDSSIRRRVEAADPRLDADLADWTDLSSPRPKLTLLGPVQVRAQGSLPERNPRRHFYTEIVAYLATRPHGASIEQYATAIWPLEPDILGKTKVRQSISIVREWLGSDPSTGGDYLPSAAAGVESGRYRIQDILIDAELFRRLRLRGQARGATGIPDLRAALDLVTGAPFDHLPRPRRRIHAGYTWLIEDNSRLDHEYAAMIVDVAHTVATHHLAAGEPELAADAARIALRAGSFEDVPLLDLVAACDALGDRAEADAYVARILANHDAEVEEDLPPRTADILYRRQRGGAVG